MAAESSGCRVRRARPEDWESVKPFCTDTFRWGDYIDRVWNAWVESGNLLIFEDDNHAIQGMAHVEIYGEDSWVEGIRIRPESRRRGIGTILLDKAEEVVVAAGAIRVRTAIEQENTPSMKMFKSVGYRREQDWYMYAGSTADEHCDMVEAAPPERWPKLYVRSWTWSPPGEELPPERVVAIRDGPVAVVADSERFGDTTMCTLWHSGDNPYHYDCIIRHASGMAYRSGRRLEVFSTHPVQHHTLHGFTKVGVLRKDL